MTAYSVDKARQVILFGGMSLLFMFLIFMATVLAYSYPSLGLFIQFLFSIGVIGFFYVVAFFIFSQKD